MMIRYPRFRDLGDALRLVTVIVLLGSGFACGKASPAGQGSDAAHDIGSQMSDAPPMTALQAVAAIVIPNCAIGGCHDATSTTHGMDLTTADKIYIAWVNKPGFDHCTGREVPRVVPGNPDNSLVLVKITGEAVCPLSQRMPLPPRDMLTAEQIQVIRSWVVAGAPSDRPEVDGGSPVDGATDLNGDAGDDPGSPTCSSSVPCDEGMTCSADSCGDPWQCLAHFDETLEHPCAIETIPFCGCDGVTFQASYTCPDRPWLHAGACGDGASCTKEQVRCTDPAPNCAKGQVPSVVNDCWGPCVDVTQCRCLYHWQCPDLAVNSCIEGTFRCGPKPKLADGGTSASDVGN